MFYNYELFYIFMMQSKHFSYSYMVLNIWFQTIKIMSVETCCHHFMGYSFQLARTLLYAPPHRQDSMCTDQSIHQEGSITRPFTPRSDALPLSYISPIFPSTATYTVHEKKKLKKKEDQISLFGEICILTLVKIPNRNSKLQANISP